jgi:hypothetical protein
MINPLKKIVGFYFYFSMIFTQYFTYCSLLRNNVEVNMHKVLPLKELIRDMGSKDKGNSTNKSGNINLKNNKHVLKKKYNDNADIEELEENKMTKKLNEEFLITPKKINNDTNSNLSTNNEIEIDPFEESYVNVNKNTMPRTEHSPMNDHFINFDLYSNVSFVILWLIAGGLVTVILLIVFSLDNKNEK